MTSESAASTLYIDCVGGVAGDMLLAALIDAGAPIDIVGAGLPIPGLRLRRERVERGGAGATLITVLTGDDHTHRTWRDIRRLIDSSRLPERARTRAHAAFTLLARAEGRVHGISPEEVSFHEVGSLDAIADICGVALALEELGIDDVVCSPLPLGRGTTAGSHGVLPLPAPATLELLLGAEIHGMDATGETVTPTGAALVASLARAYGPIPRMTLTAVGTGAGRRNPAHTPNIVRALIGTPAESIVRDGVLVIETNLDDLLPELVPDAVEACFAAGALDAWTVPAGMKHGRPGIVLSALARPEREREVAEAILRHTSALGLRVTATARRWELERAWRTVDVAGQPVRVKLGLLDGEIVNVAPEHRDCARVAHETGRSVKAVWADALTARPRTEP